MLIDPDTICQIGIVVRDIEKTARYYAELFGVDMPEIFLAPPQEETNMHFRGKPTATRAKLCLFKLSQIHLELIEPDDEPSSWKEFLDEHGEGVHHIGFDKADYEGAVQYFEKNCMPVRHTGSRPWGSYAYMDSLEQLGVLISLKRKY